MVDKEEFYLRLNARYNQTTIKKPWNLDKIKEIIDVLKNCQDKRYQNLSPTEKYYIGKYNILEISGISKVIVRSKSDDDNFIYVTPIEEFFDKIDEQHKATGHGGRDKMLHNLKMKYNIPRVAVEVYSELCTTCNLKKTQKYAGLVVKPITSKDFNVRGQIDLIDFQSCADGQYKWLLNYQDHSTKFLYLRPLKTKRAAEVAVELLKIFLEQGAPVILQSDNGREFTAEIIKELVVLWPECKIVHGRPRHPQSQGSVERSNQDVEQMLRIWMEENKTSNWSVGCYFVQWQKNTSYHRIIGRTPYKSLYGADPKIGLRSTNLPPEILDKILTEEDLLSLNKNVDEDDDIVLTLNNDSDTIITVHDEVYKYNPDQCSSGNSTALQIGNYTEKMLDKIPITIEQASVVALNEDVSDSDITYTSQKICCICGNENSNSHSCSKCNKIVHLECGVIQEDHVGSGIYITCNHCRREESIKTNRQKSYEGQLKAADIMTKKSIVKFNELEIETFVIVAVPKFDRGPLDKKNIEGIIMDKKNNVYRIGTKVGVLKNWLTRSELTPVSSISFNYNDIPKECFISLREASANQSMFLGQGFLKCQCQPSKNQCNTKRCTCFKEQKLCNSRCHSSNPCKNK